MTPKLDERISSLEEKLKQLKTRQARLDARKRALASRQQRKDDTRRKILVGAVVLAKVEQGVIQESALRGWLDGALTREDDRELFNLE
ncbi:MAG TPA: mobilization protein [Steroidobacteraceae bacterium]|nr:mobilization protein [Steroidobacteraceae bacterium]